MRQAHPEGSTEHISPKCNTHRKQCTLSTCLRSGPAHLSTKFPEAPKVPPELTVSHKLPQPNKKLPCVRHTQRAVPSTFHESVQHTSQTGTHSKGHSKPKKPNASKYLLEQWASTHKPEAPSPAPRMGYKLTVSQFP